VLVQQQASNTSLDYHQSHVEIHLPKHEQPPSSAQLSIESIFACHNMQSKQPNGIIFCLSQHAIKATQLHHFLLVTTCNQSNPIASINFACDNMQLKKPNCIKFSLSQHAIKETQFASQRTLRIPY
jgi:hypothetical protein